MTVAPRRVARTIASARVSTFPPPVPVVPSGLVVLTVRLDWRIESTRASGATPTNPVAGSGAAAMMPATRVP